MTRLARIPVVLAAAAALAVPSAFADSGGRTIELMSVQQRFATVPPASPQSRPAVGLRMVFQDRTFNRGAQFGKPAGAQVGRAEGCAR
jgi:hypothetical protein